MKALVLDFDGVIADSAQESFAVALATYRDLRPGARLTPEEGTFPTRRPSGSRPPSLRRGAP